MFGLSFPEILLLAALGLILLGPEQLPDLARALGKFLNELKRTRDGFSEEFKKTGLHPSQIFEEIKKETPRTNSTQVTTPPDLMPPGKPITTNEPLPPHGTSPVVTKKTSDGSDNSGN